MGVASAPMVTYPGRFCGTTLRNNVSRLVVVYSYSKWPEVIPVTTPSAAKTIEELRMLFATHGLPEQLVSDNGSQLTSEEFITFMRNNGIKNIKSAPYYPATNGGAERFVQTFKQVLCAVLTEKKTLS